MANFKLAIRALVRTPFVSSVAIASIALGIGANTAIFSLIQSVLLRPLPVPEPDRLVNILGSEPNYGSQSCNRAGRCEVVFSYPMFRDLERAQTVLTGLAGHRTVLADLAFRGRTQSGEGMAVSGSYFPVLGLKPALGRLFGPDDDRVIGGHALVVLDYHYWSTELGADPTVLDQAISINGHPMTIIGVAPRGFDGTTLGTRPRIFVPLTMRGVMEPWAERFENNRRDYWVYLFGRLKPGVSREQALAKLNALYRPIIAEVELPLQEGVSDQMRSEFKAKQIRLEPGARGQSTLQSQTTTPLALLFSITAIVLLVACINVANLLLARAASRSGEIAVRSSLGAGRGQLIVELLAEAGLLALVAGTASLFVAKWTLTLITSFLPPELAGTIDFGLDAPVLAFATVVLLGTTMLFGLFPAIHSTRSDLLTVTKAESGRGPGGRKTTRFRTSLVTAQIALSTALLGSAGLFVRSLVNVNRVELGIRTDSVVTFAVSPQQIGYRPSETRALFARIGTELAGLPGVTGATSALVPVIRSWNTGGDVDVDGFPTTAQTDVNSRLNYVGVDYFKTLGIPVLAGREFKPSDDIGTPGVVIVNEAFAKKFNLGANPIGRRMRIGNALSPETRAHPGPDREIIGLVKDAAYSEVKDKVPPVFFMAARQDTTLGRLTFYARTRSSPAQLVGAIPRLIANLEPNLPVVDLKTLPQQIDENVFLDRMITTLSAGFAILATLLAAVGLYGVLAYSVTQRTREIGLRMALGADSGRVLGMVLRQVGWMTVVGGTIGTVAAFAIGRSAQSLLYGLQGHDLAAFVGAGIILALVALSAGYVPALRASRVHPMVALRGE
ncbi:MAG: ABC transporter permease [Gemmatimonadota bacterium]